MISALKESITFPYFDFGIRQSDGETIQIVADLANTVASHTHNGGPAPDQSSTFSGYNSRALNEKGKLTPIIEQ
ncbi:hypothetical protein [Avibacterium sp. 21-594]|uniref:hypothetical protein n=1 Tax=Avibacterium sp. 21-594 TaxID=2911535 RepID=UPI00224691DE|nr:hypothetical protein [Avibacterium sp. 21-594]MCW9715995.1 hypothetical protein [Avibacterium sp. 21-594]